MSPDPEIVKTARTTPDLLQVCPSHGWLEIVKEPEPSRNVTFCFCFNYLNRTGLFVKKRVRLLLSSVMIHARQCTTNTCKCTHP